MTTPPIFALVLHHRYADPRPHDHSGNANYGYGQLERAVGRNGRRSALAFDGIDDRIFVPPSATLSRPGGIRADICVLVEELGHRRTLIEGYLSFGLGVESNGAVSASIYRHKEWSGVRSGAGLVPLGSWITVSFTYTPDGVMALSIDDSIVAASYRQLGDADGVSWPFGLSIGAWPDADQRVLKGRVDEVKLWRTWRGQARRSGEDATG